MRAARRLRVVAVNILLLGVILASAEIAARIFFSAINSSEKLRSIQIKEKAYAYDPADYELLNRSGCPSQKIITLNTDGSSVRHQNPDWSCGGVTSKAGKRLTTNQPASAENIIHIFGGSTVWGAGSLDGDTIPSNVQKILNNSHPGKYKVVNQGFTTLVAIQQYQKLRSVNLKRGDIVIFYDGGNDVTQRAIYGRPEGTVIGYNQSNKLGILASDVRKYLAVNSRLYVALSSIKSSFTGKINLAESHFNDECPPSYFDTISANGSTERVWESYFKTLLLSKKYAEENHAYFYHFMQPIAFDYIQINGGDEEYYDSIMMGKKCFNKKLSMAYKDLREKYRSYAADFNGKSLSNVLMPSDSTRRPIHYFTDWIHVTAPANYIISNSIWSSLRNSLN